MLFICFINDTPEVIHSNIEMFADDAKIFQTVYSPDQPQLLQNSLNAQEDWSNLWQLKFNAKKWKIMHVDNRNKDFNYHMHKEGIKVKLHLPEMKSDHSVYDMSKLTFSTH